MKKYQLKYNNGTELELLVSSDDMFDILWEIRYSKKEEHGLQNLSIWMNGQVLD